MPASCLHTRCLDAWPPTAFCPSAVRRHGRLLRVKIRLLGGQERSTGNYTHGMKSRWLAITLYVAVAISILFWGLKFFPVSRPPADAGARLQSMVFPGELPAMRGNEPPPNPVPAVALAADSLRFQLIGVIAPRDPNSGSQGVALIAIDGKPAQAFRVGDMLGSDRILQAVQLRGVLIGPRGGATSILLELPGQGSAGSTKLDANAPDSGQTAIQARSSRNLLTERPPMPGISSLQSSAPNTLLNNPADMAPADASSSVTPPDR